jgi:hypothetical protein
MNNHSPVGMMLQFAFGSGPMGAKASNRMATRGSGAIDTPPQMLALVAAATAWWESGRPEGWSLEQHLADPAAGCNGSAQERALAEAVALWVKQG